MLISYILLLGCNYMHTINSIIVVYNCRHDFCNYQLHFVNRNLMEKLFFLLLSTAEQIEIFSCMCNVAVTSSHSEKLMIYYNTKHASHTHESNPSSPLWQLMHSRPFNHILENSMVSLLCRIVPGPSILDLNFTHFKPVYSTFQSNTGEECSLSNSHVTHSQYLCTF